MRRIGLRRGYYPYFEGRREDALVMRCALPLAPAGRLAADPPAHEAGIGHAE
jgi:hypothetical protein